MKKRLKKKLENPRHKRQLNRKHKIDPPKHAKDPRWDLVDEHGWESFPASDPPGNY